MFYFTVLSITAIKMAWLLLSKYKIFLGTTACFISLFGLIRLVDHWTQQGHPLFQLLQVNEISMKHNTQADMPLKLLREKEYENRIRRVRDVCKRDGMTQRGWTVAENRQDDKPIFCSSQRCPIVAEERIGLFFCFIPKVASTHIKRYFLNITNITVTAKEQNTFYIANKRLRRVSPTYYPSETAKRFFKIMFVRHPFERLVSAFRDKAEKKDRSFYNGYWKPIMTHLRPKGAPTDNITFAEFVWYLIHSSKERDVVNGHWTPFWTRCGPCEVNYDFIGKLETARQDFPYAFHKIGIDSSTDWWDRYSTTNNSLTLQYFSTITEEAIRKLYDLYKPDFDLFGYSIDEFLPGNGINIQA